MNVLAIGHEASRTGAPILLQAYLQWLTSGNKASVRCLLSGGGPLGGPLVPAMQQICDTFVADGTAFQKQLFPRMRRRLGLLSSSDHQLKRWLAAGPTPDLIYVNTIAAIPALQRLERMFTKKIPSVIHIHELTWLLESYVNSHQIQNNLASAASIIAVSEAVRNAIVETCRLPAESIDLVYEWLCRTVVSRADRAAHRSCLRQTLGISPDAVVCAGLGVIQWRKGTEFLPIIARHCQDMGLHVHFLWCGIGSADHIRQLQIDAKKLGVSGCVHFLGEVPDPSPVLSAADIFVLPSREDPYPLAMLEGALYELPIVCFEQSGGAPELMLQGAGVAVPYLDTHAFAEAIVDLSNDPVKRAEIGRFGSKYVQQHHSLENAAPQIWSLMQTAASVKSNT